MDRFGFNVILNEYLVPFMQNYPIGGCRILQDNDSKHYAGVCKNSYNINNIRLVILICNVKFDDWDYIIDLLPEN